MSEVSEILKAVKSGETSPADAGNQIKALINKSAEDSLRSAPEDDGYTDSAYQRFVDKDDSGYQNSFNQVTAAWIAGGLTDGQYHTIREGVVPQGNKG